MSKQVLADLDFVSVSRILNLPDGTAPQQPATVAQLNAAVEGLAWKDSVRVASTANINLAAPGATIDGIAMASGDRFLAKDQSTASANGIYVWNGAATPANARADANTSAELEQAVLTVEEGTSAAATFRQTAVNFVLDTGAVTWATFGTAAPAASETVAGIAQLATQAKTDTGTDDLTTVTPLKLKTWASAPKRFQQNVGDGSATQYTVTHNLNSARRDGRGLSQLRELRHSTLRHRSHVGECGPPDVRCCPSLECVSGCDPRLMEAVSDLQKAGATAFSAASLFAALPAPVATSGATETLLHKLQVPANSVAVGTVFDIFLEGISSSTGTLIFRVRAGAAGTIADGQGWISITSAAQVANQRAGFWGTLTVRSIGVAGTVQIECLGHAQAALLPTLVAAVVLVTVNTTAAWFIDLSCVCSVGTFTAQQALIEKVV
jgi:hypothetical protein